MVMFSARLAWALRSPKAREHAWRAIANYDALFETTCSCCGYVGKFDSFGLDKVRMGATCPQCHGMERHRLMALALRDGFLDFAGKSVLHFAPEPAVRALVKREAPGDFLTADLDPVKGDLVLNIEAINLPDAQFDRVICSHVLEHVDDAKALAEMRRILTPGGYIAIMVPIVEGWDASFEDPSIQDEDGRTRYFGQYDHIRYYGADLRQRIRAAGLDLQEYTASARESPQYGLMRGEKVFKAIKPA